MTSQDANDSHSYVTFEGFARLLRERGIDPNATGASVRHIARTRKGWPIGEEGEGKPYTYGTVANARTLPLKPGIDFYESQVKRAGVRGPDTKPRKKRSSGGAS